MSESHAKRQRRVVLSEEEYTSTLNDIVQRDYFPDLPNLRRQVAVLDRRASGDFPGAVAVRRAARQLEQHEEALAEQEHEEETDVGPDSLRKTPRPLHRESITGFHARVTSEDNEEFDSTQRKEVQENRERLQKVFSASASNQRMITDGRAQGSETPLLASDKFSAPSNRIAASEWKHTEIGTNGLFFSPQQHVVPSGQPSQENLITNAGTSDDKSSSTKEKQLMPPPAPVQKSPAAGSSTEIVVKQDMVEYVPKAAVEKTIDPSQTRFPTQVALPPPQVRLDTEDASSTDYSTEASTDLDAPLPPISVEREARAKRKRKEQETLVAMTPLLVPRSTANESPITTWGIVSATPMVLGNTETTFTMPAESDRDAAARTAEKTLEKRRRRTKTPRSSLSKTPLEQMTSSLTPAARSLLNKATPQRSVRSSSAFSSALRSSYTPKRNTSSSKSSSRLRDSAAQATPRIASGRQSTKSGNEKDTGNLTDGLLQLPKQT